MTFYYLLHNSFGARITEGWAFGRDGRRLYPSCLDNLKAVKARLERVYIEHHPFGRTIKTWDHECALFYCDPPYVGTEGYYTAGAGAFGIDQHQALADALKGIKGRFILSYEDHETVRDMYRWAHVTELREIRRTLNNKPGNRTKKAMEIAITNFVPAELADGITYRQGRML